MNPSSHFSRWQKPSFFTCAQDLPLLSHLEVVSLSHPVSPAVNQSPLSQTVLLSMASKALIWPLQSHPPLSALGLVSTSFRPPGLSVKHVSTVSLTPGPLCVLSSLPGVLVSPQDKTLGVQPHSFSTHWGFLSHSVGFTLSSAQETFLNHFIENQSLLCFSKFPVWFPSSYYYNLFFSLLF